MSTSSGAAQSCPSLSQQAAGIEFESGAGMLGATRALLTPHGWGLQTNAPAHWAGPRVRGHSTSISIADALRTWTQAAQGAGWQVQTVLDHAHCVVRIEFAQAQMLALAPAPAPAPVATFPTPIASAPDQAAPAIVAPVVAALPEPPAPRVLQAGQSLSSALMNLAASQGWSLRWGLNYDHFIEAPITLPDGDLQTAIAFVVSTYQAQGGLIGVAPRFAQANRIIYITERDHAR